MEKLLDGEVELLVRFGRGSGHDPVDFAQSGCSRKLIGQRWIGPGRATSAHAKGPHGLRVGGLSLRQQFDALAVGQVPVDKHDRQLTANVAKAPQPLECRGRRAFGVNVIVLSVPPAKMAHNGRSFPIVGGNHENHCGRARHFGDEASPREVPASAGVNADCTVVMTSRALLRACAASASR